MEFVIKPLQKGFDFLCFCRGGCAYIFDFLYSTFF